METENPQLSLTPTELNRSVGDFYYRSEWLRCPGWVNMNLQTNDTVPVVKKYLLSIHEASDYFSIGTKKLRCLAEENLGRFAVTAPFTQRDLWNL